MSGHFYAPCPLLIGAAFWDTLSPEYQTIIQDAAYEARDYMRGRNDAEEAEQLQECIDVHGCEVITEVDIEAWQAAMQPVYDEFVGEGKAVSQELVDAVVNFGK